MIKEYYYLKGKEQIGPLNIDEIKALNLDKETLLWTEGLTTWNKLQEFDELRSKSVPPPIPNFSVDNEDTLVNNNKSLISDNSIEKINFSPSKNEWVFFIVWFTIHTLAVILSYAKIDLFSANGGDARKFWPLTEIYSKHSYGYYSFEHYSFSGLFAYYDITEYAVYLILPVFLFFFYKLINPKANFKFEGANFLWFLWLLNLAFLLLSYTKLNNSGTSDISDFWPFNSNFEIYNSYSQHPFEHLLADYDVSEFLIYSFIIFIVFYFIRVFNFNVSSNSVVEM